MQLAAKALKRQEDMQKRMDESQENQKKEEQKNRTKLRAADQKTS